MTATTLRREILGGAAVNMAAEVVVQLNWVRVCIVNTIKLAQSRISHLQPRAFN